MVRVELVYIPADKPAVHMHLNLAAGSTVADAINQSGLEAIHPETADLAIGIFAKRVTQDTILNEGDRIEVYRSLTIDPKEKRRQRAQKKRP